MGAVADTHLITMNLGGPHWHIWPFTMPIILDKLFIFGKNKGYGKIGNDKEHYF